MSKEKFVLYKGLTFVKQYFHRMAQRTPAYDCLILNKFLTGP